jgi:hypothetical protein
MTTIPASLQPLAEAADGLLMPSETDAPFAPFCWPDVTITDLTLERVRELAGAASNAKVESVSLSSFFRDATKIEEWHNAEEAATVQRFKTLVKEIKRTLKSPRVWRVGETTIDCYIAGLVFRLASRMAIKATVSRNWWRRGILRLSNVAQQPEYF